MVSLTTGKPSTAAAMKSILYTIFCKPTFFYNPVMEKSEGGYSITVYKHWMGKSSISRIFTNDNPLQLLAIVRIFVRTANEVGV